MSKYTCEFSDKDGQLDELIAHHLKARPNDFIVSGPNLSNAVYKIYECTFVEGKENAPGYAKDLTRKYRAS